MARRCRYLDRVYGLLSREPAILDRTMVGRTTIPDSIKKLLRIDLSDYVEWGFDGFRMIARRNDER